MDFRGLAAAVVAWLVLALPTAAFADGPLEPNGSRIRTSEYTVDLSHGLVLDGSRPSGLGGAYVALAEGVDGMPQNPVAPAHRLPYSFSDFDYDLGAGITLPTTVASADYFNSGHRTTDLGTQSEREQFLFLSVAGLVQWGEWGFGVSYDFQNFGLRRTHDPSVGAATDRLSSLFTTARFQLARRLDDFLFGGGVRLTALSVSRQESSATQATQLFGLTGMAIEGGLLWRPTGMPFRVGASVRSGVTSEPAQGDEAIRANTGDWILRDPNDPTNLDAPGTFYLPRRLSQPWALNAGAAVQIGPRPFNPRWVNPDRVVANLSRYVEWRRKERRRRRDAQLRRVAREGGDVASARAALDAEIATEDALDAAQLEREQQRVDRELRARYAALKRFYVLMSASVVLTGAVEDGVGVESFLQQRVARSGQRVSLSPRLGIESEVVPHWLRVRGGTYLEPTRFSTPDVAPRLHTTVGLDLRLLPWTVFALFREGTNWRVGAMLDAAPRYLGWGATVGVWH